MNSLPAVNRSSEHTVTSDERRRLRVQASLVNVWEQHRPNPPITLRIGKAGKFGTIKLKRIFSPKESVEEKKSPRWVAAVPREGIASPQLSLSSTRSLQNKADGAKRRIAALYEELAEVLVKSKLSFSEKKSRIGTYLGALQVIIEASVCHGDLKPENILWDETDFVISDFNGSIVIDDVCELMKEKFRFKSEEEKNAVKRIVYPLADQQVNPAVFRNKDAVQKLIDWEILAKDGVTVLSRELLLELREYLAVTFLPDCSRGYASDFYYGMMCDAFWQCNKEKFRRACQAFDIRAAGLTIYAILTGTYPPENERQKEYYNTLEQSLKKLGISVKAAALIRKMAEPRDIGFVKIDELKELQDEFCREKKALNPDAEDVKMLEDMQATVRRLTLLQLDDAAQTGSMQYDLLNAVSKSEIDPEEGISFEMRKTLIEAAFNAYPDACEVATSGFTTVLLLNPDDLSDYDVVVKRKPIGDGASAIAYEAYSLRFLKSVVIKYAQEFVSPQDAQNGAQVLSQLGEHEGLQKQFKRYRLQRNEDYKQVVVEPFYKNRDFAPCILGDLFCSKCGITKEQHAVRMKLQEIDRALQGNLSEQELQNFMVEYGKVFGGILGVEKIRQLLEDYKLLMAEALKARQSEEAKQALLFQEEVTRASELVKGCAKRVNGVVLLDLGKLEELIQHADLSKEAIKAATRQEMIQAIRRCQKVVMLECLLNTVNNSPGDIFKEWERVVKEVGEQYLDFKGVKSISKLLGVTLELQENEKSDAQKRLQQQLEHKNRVFEVIA